MDKKRKVFVSFRFEDGEEIKKDLIDHLIKKDLIIDKSENIDRRELSEETIKKYLFEKLKDSSITIVLLTPMAVNYERTIEGIDDWLYDELRYSLYNRENNPINGVIAVYTKEAKQYLIRTTEHICNVCKEKQTVDSILEFDNLIRDNMFNIKQKFKLNKCDGIYDLDYDVYISLISLEDFLKESKKYIDIAFEKRNIAENYTIKVFKD